jgi:hypothetical protein
MSKKILIATPYNCFVQVTFRQAEELMQCKVYNESGCGDNATYEQKDKLDLRFVDEGRLTEPTVQDIELSNILEENNRLTRLVKQLEYKLKAQTPSDSKELSTEEML